MKKGIRFKAVRNGKSVCAQGIYRKTYKKGSTVEAEPNTFGIMTFDTQKNALVFIRELFYPVGDSFKVIKVRPVGRGRRVKDVSKIICEENISYFYKEIKQRKMLSSTLPAPKGTICYRSVEVLE